MNEPKLSIVIITLNEQERLPRLLDDLAVQSWKDFEIIHVDSNSDDATVALSKDQASRFPAYRVIEMTDRGVSLGRNRGAAAARGKRLLFLDADTRLAPDFLEIAVRELDNGTADVGIVLMSSKNLPVLQKLGFGAFNFGIRLTKVFFPSAIVACLFSTPDIHSAIGGFDERIQLCEDCDYVLRASSRKEHKQIIISQKFRFDPRRLDQDGLLATGLIYVKANLRRLFSGELRNQEIAYQFGHYK